MSTLKPEDGVASIPPITKGLLVRKVITIIRPLDRPEVEIKIISAPAYKQERLVIELLGSCFEISKKDIIAAVENATNWETGE